MDVKDTSEISAKCQVFGCEASLSVEGSASLRVKTCEAHRRALVVAMDGFSTRYCQQCARFHRLEEFDGEKRGCRKRLERHNLRRKRKSIVKRMDKTLRDSSLDDQIRELGMATLMSYGLGPDTENLPDKLEQILREVNAGLLEPAAKLRRGPAQPGRLDPAGSAPSADSPADEAELSTADKDQHSPGKQELSHGNGEHSPPAHHLDTVLDQPLR
uniref:Squamosa promoter binding protein 2 n=1 Tax=Tetraselmis sp. GSL018 TaxID=582737 RepID=A0A061QJ55_9CHLO